VKTGGEWGGVLEKKKGPESETVGENRRDELGAKGIYRLTSN